MYKKIAVTNRKLCADFFSQLEILKRSDYDLVILREKDMSEAEYAVMAEKALKIMGEKLILHTFIPVCEDLNCKRIHLPLALFEKNIDDISSFELKGASIHSIDEAKRAERLGADYITASHIFATDCKAGLEPKGLEWLSDIYSSVGIPVYALGGINENNAEDCIKAGADGVCMMSEAMKYK